MNKRIYIKIILSTVFLTKTLFAQKEIDSSAPIEILNDYNNKVIYSQARHFRGQVFRIDDGNREFFPDCRKFHKLLSKNEAGRNHIEEYIRFRRITKPLAYAGTAITVNNIVWYVKDPDMPAENPFLFWGSLALGQLFNLSAGYFSTKGQISLYAAIREYNINIIPLLQENKTDLTNNLEIRLQYRF